MFTKDNNERIPLKFICFEDYMYSNYSLIKLDTEIALIDFK